MKQIFIHTNKKQEIGAIVSKYSIERYSSKYIPIHIKYVEDCSEICKYDGSTYLRGENYKIFKMSDLQSFTLLRFCIPEYCNFSGTALVIDPDIFVANNTDINDIFDLSMSYKVMACYNDRKKSFKSSVMVLNNEKLTNWGFKLIDKLFNYEINYTQLMNLKYQDGLVEIDSGWNDFDKIDINTKLIHYTNRITQPWKTGLKIDFDFNLKNSGFNNIKNIIYKNFRRYKEHPNPAAFNHFINLFKLAYKDGYITDNLISYHIKNNNIRHDIVRYL